MNNSQLGSAPVTDVELNLFVADLNLKRKAHFAVEYPTLYGPLGSRPYEDFEFITARIGGKNIKLVTTGKEPSFTAQKPDANGRFSRSVYCFIEKSSGNILKAAGFNAPAKGVRGNIRDEGYWMKALTPYGAAYLR